MAPVLVALSLLMASVGCWAGPSSSKSSGGRIDGRGDVPPPVIRSISDRGPLISDVTLSSQSKSSGSGASFQCASLPDMSSPNATLPTDAILGISSRQALRGCPTVIQYIVAQQSKTGGGVVGGCAVLYVTNNQQVDYY